MALLVAILASFFGCREKTEEGIPGAMAAFVEAQKRHHQKAGRYAENWPQLEGLPAGMAGATSASSGFRGYYFVPIELNGARPLNYEREFVLCAVPCTYGPETNLTYVIGPKGILLTKDTGGVAPDNATDLADGTWPMK